MQCLRVRKALLRSVLTHESRNLQIPSSFICMPPNSGSTSSLHELPNVEWALLGCSTPSEKLIAHTIVTFSGSNGGNLGDRLGLSICCKNVGDEVCVDFFQFEGVPGGFLDNTTFPIVAILSPGSHKICAEVSTVGLNCRPDDVRIRFASGTEDDDRQIALLNVTIQCPPPPLALCYELAELTPALLSNLSVTDGICQPGNVETVCSSCK